MIKRKLKVVVTVLAVGFFVVMAIVRAEAPTTSDATPEAPDVLTLVMPPLTTYIDTLLTECGGNNLSPAIRHTRAEQLERASNKWLKGLAKYAFVALPCLETRMGSHKSQVSTAGARGFIQLMPATAKAEAIRCGFGEVKDEDLMDPELNINIAACHFADLVEKHGVELAAYAYNGGGGSEALRLAKKLMPGGPKETLGYAAIHSLIMFRALSEGGKK